MQESGKDRQHQILAVPGGVKTRNFDIAGPGGERTQSFDEGQETAEFVSIGGGRGAFHGVNGDYPVASTRRTGKQKEHLEHEGNTGEFGKIFIIYGKNVQSIQTDARLLELFAEIEMTRHWDAVLLNETWREPKEESNFRPRIKT